MESNEFLRDLYIKNSRLPLRYIEKINLRPSTSDLNSFKKLKSIEDNIELFVKKHENLLISSNTVGNGKTSWACRLIMSYINNYACKYVFKDNTPVLFVNVPEFLMKKKMAISNPSIAEEIDNIEKSIFSSSIVVFDDIATKTASDYDKELLYIYINSRTNNLKTNIYTTNVSQNELENELGERIADRIIGYSICIELTGSSRRDIK